MLGGQAQLRVVTALAAEATFTTGEESWLTHGRLQASGHSRQGAFELLSLCALQAPLPSPSGSLVSEELRAGLPHKWQMRGSQLAPWPGSEACAYGGRAGTAALGPTTRLQTRLCHSPALCPWTSLGSSI